MKKIKLALVGRPNVGKSALFNCICGKRQAIVDEQEGTTRDRLYGETELFGKPLTIIDTGGIDTGRGVLFGEEIKRQAEIAIEESDALIMVVDGKAGLTPLDSEIARFLLRQKKPICLAVNKVDDLSKMLYIHEFHSLGISNMVAVSATQGFQIAELLESALDKSLLLNAQEETQKDTIYVAIVGKPNVGKSTLLNHLLHEDRSVVSPIAGTTRDSIDAELIVNETSFTFIDTAGVRKKKSEHEAVDKFAAVRTERAIERADICLLMLDAQEGLTAHEKRIASMIEEQGKGCILVVNKWDLVEGHRMEHCELSLKNDASFLNYVPKLFISAEKQRNLNKLFPLIKEVKEGQKLRIGTGALNRFLEKALQGYHPPMIQGKRLRIYYMAHVEMQPPTFVLFVNYPELMQETYKRYLIHKFRESYGFIGNPLVFILRARKRAAFVGEKGQDES